MPTEMELNMEQPQQGVSYDVSVSIEGVEDVKEIFNTTAGNPVKKILLKLNLSDHRKLKEGGEVLKLKNFKKDATLKLSKSSNQEWYEHVGPEVTSYTRWQSFKMAKRLCLVDDLKMLKITMSNTKLKEQAQSKIQEHYNIIPKRMSQES
ncbi:hypothetical protein Tco_0398320 [Tanacetum coccineum]